MTHTASRTHNPRVSDRVRIERDGACYPSRGTWPQFRGRTDSGSPRSVESFEKVLAELGVPEADNRSRSTRFAVAAVDRRPARQTSAEISRPPS